MKHEKSLKKSTIFRNPKNDEKLESCIRYHEISKNLRTRNGLWSPQPASNLKLTCPTTARSTALNSIKMSKVSSRVNFSPKGEKKSIVYVSRIKKSESDVSIGFDDVEERPTVVMENGN